MKNISFFFLLLLSLSNLLCLAEGGRTLTPGNNGVSNFSQVSPLNNTIGYLQKGDGGNSDFFLQPGSPANERLYIHMEKKDKLYYGIQRNEGSGNMTLTLRYNDTQTGTDGKPGIILKQNTLTGATAFTTTLPGVIDTRAQMNAGPNRGSNPAGYDPLMYENLTGAAHEFWIEIHDAGSKDVFDLWDFSVYDSTGVEKPGRLYSHKWSFQCSGASNRVSADFQLYSLIPGVNDPNVFYVKKISIAGMQPYGFLFMSNSSGTNVAGTYVDKRKSTSTKALNPEYAVFVNDPDSIVWPSAQATSLKYVAVPYCNIQDQSGNVVFNFYLEQASIVTLLLNIDGVAGFQSGGQDVFIEQDFLSSGYKSLYWNGKDGNGAIVTTGISVQFYFKSQSAAVHYPLWDAEDNSVGFKISTVRPGHPGYTLLFWDDSQISGTTGTKVELLGTYSANGVHKWSGTNNLLHNTWSYGDINADTNTVYLNFICDRDQDGIPDYDALNPDDIDDDNDGIPDIVEGLGADPSADADSDGVPNYIDIDFVHPTLGVYVDEDGNGVNDIFDRDGDGIPNHLDKDSDGDGIPDAIEANGGVAPAGFDSSTLGMSGTVGVNGMPDNTETGSETGLTVFPIPDSDGDGIPDYLDADSDNDGIPDNIEAQSTSGYVAPSGVDSDADGIDDAYDPQSGGSSPILSVYNFNSGSDAIPDYLDNDSDGDGKWDNIEAFDANGNGTAFDDLLALGAAFEASTGAGFYINTQTQGAGSTSLNADWMDDTDTDGVLNFLDPDSPYYHDSDGDGLVDLLDPDSGGSPAPLPDNGGNTSDYDFRDIGTNTTLPVSWLGLSLRQESGNVNLNWSTATELNSGVFQVQRSADAFQWTVIGEVQAAGNSNSLREYLFVDEDPLRGMAYYRIREIDFDGKEFISEVRSILLVEQTIRVQPNPVAAGEELEIISSGFTDAILMIMDMRGTILSEYSLNGNSTKVSTEGMYPGMYVLTVRQADQDPVYFRVIISQ